MLGNERARDTAWPGAPQALAPDVGVTSAQVPTFNTPTVC